MDEGDAEWPIPWVTADEQPIGVAVVPFTSPSSNWIVQILGLQNAVNKSWLDLLASADSAGFPFYSIEYPEGPKSAPAKSDDDIEGEDEFVVGPGRFQEVFGGSMRQHLPADLKPMIDTVWAFVTAVSGMTRIPQYYMRPVGGSNVLSGEALKQLESGLVKRAEERQLFYGQTWEDVFSLAMRVQSAFGKGMDIDEGATISIAWDSPEVRNEAAEAATAEAHDRLGVDSEQVWLRLGYTPEEIAVDDAFFKTSEARKPMT